MDNIRVHAFVRQPTHTKKPNTVSGYFNFEPSINNPVITGDTAQHWVMESVKRVEDLFHGGSKEDLVVIKSHINRFNRTYFGDNVLVTFGNLYKTIDTTQVNKETGETYIQKRKVVIPQASFIAVHDDKLLLVEIHIGHVIHQFFGEEYYIRNEERNYAVMQQHEASNIVPIGSHQVIPCTEKANKTKLDKERDVLAMLEKGIKVAVIAREVGVSRPTIYAIKARYE